MDLPCAPCLGSLFLVSSVCAVCCLLDVPTDCPVLLRCLSAAARHMRLRTPAVCVSPIPCLPWIYPVPRVWDLCFLCPVCAPCVVCWMCPLTAPCCCAACLQRLGTCACAPLLCVCLLYPACHGSTLCPVFGISVSCVQCVRRVLFAGCAH